MHITLGFHVIFAVVVANCCSSIVMPFTYATHYVRKRYILCVQSVHRAMEATSWFYYHTYVLTNIFDAAEKKETIKFIWAYRILCNIIINLNLPQAFLLFSICPIVRTHNANVQSCVSLCKHTRNETQKKNERKEKHYRSINETSVHENHIWWQMQHVLSLGNFAMLHFIAKECKCGLNNVKNTWYS